MKKLMIGFAAALTSVLLGTAAFADTKDLKKFTFDGAPTAQTFELSAEKNHVEYKYETVTKTCYRQEFVGYRTHCETRYDRVCRDERSCYIVNGVRQCSVRTVCHSVPRHHCYQVAEYRTVPYTCQETVKIPYTVKDYDVKAQVKVSFGQVPQGLKVKEAFELVLSGDKLTIKATNKKSNVLVFAHTKQHDHHAGMLKTIDAEIQIDFIALEDLTGPLEGAKKISLENEQNLAFNLKSTQHAELFDVSLLVTRAKFLAKNDIMVETQLPLEGIAVASLNKGVAHYSLPLLDLGFPAEEFKKGTFKVEIIVEAKLDATGLLNPDMVPKNLSVKSKGSFKIKK